MTRAKGSFDFLRRECVVGTALRVERTYLGRQFAFGEGVTLDYSWLVEIGWQVSRYLHLVVVRLREQAGRFRKREWVD